MTTVMIILALALFGMSCLAFAAYDRKRQQQITDRQWHDVEGH
jgi:hypothetical protein